MIVTLLGVRGSRPVAMMDVLRYGGNTTSFKIEAHDMPPIYVDGGTGLYEEGLRLGSEGIPETLNIFVTHTHWDHILAFPFFKPLYHEGCSINIYAPVSRGQRFIELIQGQHTPRAFPVPFSQLKANQNFIDAKPGDCFDLGSSVARCFQLNHPGTTLGWRFEADDRAVAIITDTAPIAGNYLGEGMSEKAESDPTSFEASFHDGLVDFMRNADLVIFDTHFTEEGIVDRRHWGHSTPEMAIDLCLEAGAKRLVLHHHAPEDTDERVDKKADAIWKKLQNHNLQVEPGVEGMKIWL